MGLFDKKDPREQVKEWKSSVRKEGFKLDRQISAIGTKEKQVEAQVRKLAKEHKYDEVKTLARALVDSKKAVKKLYTAKAHLSSLILQLDEQAAHLRMMGALKQSAQIMSAMNALVKLPEMQATFRELSKEMMKAGILQEMVEDVTSSMTDADSEEAEREADSEVDKILWDITAGELGRAPAAIDDALPEAVSEEPSALKSAAAKGKPARIAVTDGPSSSQQAVSDDVNELHERLANLRS